MGKHFSLGSELLVAELRARGWSQGDLAKALHEAGGKLLATSVINRWAHGLRRPMLPWAVLLHKVLGIALTSWNEPPSAGYRLQPTGTDG